MALGTNAEEDFEDLYTAKLKALFAGNGIVIKHKRDRVGIDLGLQLTLKGKATHTRVWFQLKGKHATTLPVEQLRVAETVPIEVELEHLRFWYAAPEAVYIVLYLEATDEFIAEDVRDIVERQWNQKFLQPGTFPASQKQVTIHLQKTAKLDQAAISQLLRHRSMRIDGPQWRGGPLGHNLDPLRSALAPLEPVDYVALVESLLKAHGFNTYEHLDPKVLLPDMNDDEAILLRGRMHHTYEWTHPLFTEFGSDDTEDALRIEGQMLSVQGDCLVLIHSQGDALPKENPAIKAFAEKHSIERLMVFINKPLVPKTIGAYRSTVEPLQCMPQDLDSLAFNVLTATTVYLDFRDRLSWRYVNYLP